MADYPSAITSGSPEPTTEAKLSKTDAFALTVEHLARIARTANKVCPDATKWKARCSDGVTREFPSFEALSGYDNSATRRLEEVSIIGDQYVPLRRTFKLTLGGKTPNIWGEIVGGETLRETAIREVWDVLKDARPWYTLIARYSLLPFFILVFIVALSALYLLSADVLLLLPKDSPVYSIVARFAMGLLIVAALLGWPTHKLIRYLFPISVFLIGAGKDRDKKREIWRQISVGLAITFIGGLLIEFWLHR